MLKQINIPHLTKKQTIEKINIRKVSMYFSLTST